MRHVARNQFHNFGLDVDACEVDGRDVQHAAHADGEVHVADVLLVFINEQLYQSRTFFFLTFQQLLNLVRAQQPILDEGVGDAFGK